MHWAKRRKYRNIIGWAIYRAGNKPKVQERNLFKEANITFDIYFKVNRKRDIQNYLGGGLIAWLDVLVDLKFIFDDSSDCIGQPIVNFYIDKANPRTEITIEGR